MQTVLIENQWLVRLSFSIGILFAFLVVDFLFFRLLYPPLERWSGRRSAKVQAILLQGFKKPGKFFLMLWGFFTALQYYGLPTTVYPFALKLFRIAIIFTITWGLMNSTDTMLVFIKRFEDNREVEMDRTLKMFLSKLLKVVLVCISAVIMIGEFGYNISGIITGLGLGGLTVALAAKDTASNLFGGLVIIFDRPFKVGDYIKTPSVEGTVEDITIRSTRVRTVDDTVMVLPNSILTAEPITNYAKMNKRRATLSLSLDYGTPPDLIETFEQRIRAMLLENPDVHNENIVLAFKGFGESSLDLNLYFFTQTSQWSVHQEIQDRVNLDILRLARSLGVTFAFPTRNIYLQQENAQN